MGNIYFRTIAYNAEKTLERCIDSVLNQSFRGDDIIYYICDNGSTDRTWEILQQYASRDARLRPFRNRKNRVWEPETREYQEFVLSLRDDDYYCTLDADDAYEPAFLEEMLAFTEENRLDIAACGTRNIDSATGKELSTRSVEEPLLLTRTIDFTTYFSQYYRFMRPVWGKIFTGRAARHIYTIGNMPRELRDVSYGVDTISVFAALRHVKRVGIHSRILHRYYYSAASTSYHYDKKRFFSDVYLYHNVMDFLSDFGAISVENTCFLKRVYANAIADTVKIVANSDLKPEEKLHEMLEIVSHPVTQTAYRLDYEEIRESRRIILLSLLRSAREAGRDSAEFRTALQTLIPRCCAAVTASSVPLFERDQPLLEALSEDDRDTLVRRLMELVRMQKYTKQYDLYEMIRSLAAGHPLLCTVNHAGFLRHCPDIYFDIWDGKNAEALEKMSEMLRRGAGKNETFLRLYISLAEEEGSPDAFLAGQVQLGRLYLRRGKNGACEEILDVLSERGFAGRDEVKKLSLEAARSRGS